MSIYITIYTKESGRQELTKDEWNSRQWSSNDTYHREDGPAIERADGHKEWYQNGICSREDGPAIERASGKKEWYINGCFRRSLNKDYLIKYMELNKLNVAHLLTDPDDVLRNSATRNLTCVNILI